MHEMLGPVGRQCSGDGTCLPARLHKRKVNCPECGGTSFDHETHNPDKAFCLDCGADYEARP